MPGLDRFLPEFDVCERHARAVPMAPEEVLAAALRTPAGCDLLTRLLLGVRGIRRADLPIERFFPALGFEVLERTPTALVVGASGRPWRPRGRLGAFERAQPGAVRMVAELRAEPRPGGGSLLSTETRVAATDEGARRAFRLYWLLVGPFSALIRRRWLSAAAIASAKRPAVPSESAR